MGDCQAEAKPMGDEGDPRWRVEPRWRLGRERRVGDLSDLCVGCPTPPTLE